MRVAVTGVASGIGAAACKILKERGDEIVGFDLNEPPENIADNVDEFHKMNIADLSALPELIAGLSGNFDALLNIAGIPPRSQSDGANAGNEALVLVVNFFGLRKFTELMLEKLVDGAAIASLSSRAGSRWAENIDQVKEFMRLPETTNLQEYCGQNGIDPVRAYDLSKEAVVVWSMAKTEVLLKRDIRLNCVSPGGVSTPILEDFVEAFGAERVNRMTDRAGRACLPEEAAGVAIFLISPESKWVKGYNIYTDGGAFAMITSDQLELSEFS